MAESDQRKTPTTVDGAKEAIRIAEEAEFGSRRLKGVDRFIIPCIAAAWSLFQLSLPQILLLDSVSVRCIHLAFAILLVYLSYPALKKRKITGVFSFLSTKRGIPIIDYIIGIVAVYAALYLAVNYAELSHRQGAPTPFDIIIGIVLVVLLLEAARRSLGPFLVIVVTLFVIYSFFGPYMPDIIAFKGVSLGRFMSQITISTEGIYGIPLDVSATIVFLFVLFGSMLDKAGGSRFIAGRRCKFCFSGM